ncbi:MAG: archaeosortase/exosortase family protein [Massilia sp.]
MTLTPFPLLLAALCAAVWPVWRWFVVNSVDGSNDAAGLLAALCAIVMVWRSPAATPITRPLLLPALLLTAYALAAASAMAPAILALLAALALAALASSWRLGRRMDAALVGLCVLALPLAASLQFYGGYPLRIAAGRLAVALLRMNGLGVVREGAMLLWNGQQIAIDAPCSGVKMLWAGLFLACALAGSYRLNAGRTLAALGLATGVIVLANAVRAAALFYTEAGLIDMPPFAHQGSGMVCFAGGAGAIFAGVRALRREAA